MAALEGVVESDVKVQATIQVDQVDAAFNAEIFYYENYQYIDQNNAYNDLAKHNLQTVS